MFKIKGYYCSPNIHKVNDIIQNHNRLPPWLVIDHTIENIIVNKWPTNLYFVEIIDKVTHKDLNNANQTKLLPGTRYTRAIKIKIKEIVDLDVLFGINGNVIVKLLNSINKFDVGTINEISLLYSDQFDEDNIESWKEWLRRKQSKEKITSDYSYTLFFPNIEDGSPINMGLCVIEREINNLAKIIDPTALLKDDDGEQYLIEKWQNALRVLLNYAMAIGLDKTLDISVYERMISCKKIISKFT